MTLKLLWAANSFCNLGKSTNTSLLISAILFSSSERSVRLVRCAKAWWSRVTIWFLARVSSLSEELLANAYGWISLMLAYVICSSLRW